MTCETQRLLQKHVMGLRGSSRAIARHLNRLEIMAAGLLLISEAECQCVDPSTGIDLSCSKAKSELSDKYCCPACLAQRIVKRAKKGKKT